MEKLKQERYIYELFSELIRIAIGRAVCLSHTPTVDEWGELYAMAKKQSLVGICFAGMQKLQMQRQNPPEFLYLQWMGVAAKIQQRNEVVNQQCADLQKHLYADGFQTVVLKGQGVSSMYSEPLRGLRQSGDIDVWLQGGLEAALHLAESMGHKPKVAEHHIDLPFFADTDVEVHFVPTYLRCPWHNKRLLKWINGYSDFARFHVNELGFVAPSIEFNLVFLMLHTYRHLTSEGVGLRQVMDYYFVLNLPSVTDEIRQEAMNVLRSLSVDSFASALMYVLRVVFGLGRDYMLCDPDEKEGKWLLNEIMLAGTMGRYDERVAKSSNESKWQRYWRTTRRNIHQLGHYPTEALFSPWWRAKVWIWRKWNGWI